jgi:DivIVA domain-containing protein
MYGLNVNHSPKELLNKEFKLDAKGYRPQEVDEYLDSIIRDYTEFIRFIKNLDRDNQDLLEENNRLKAEIRKLKTQIETCEEEAESGKFSSNNIDVLKRLSNLEKIVYGNQSDNENDA